MNTSFGNIKAVAKRELIGYFSSPVAYVFLTMFLLLSGFFTFMVGRAPFFEFGQASLVTFFIWLPWLFLFLVPAVGMRLWSEERRLGTIELLLTMPITAWQSARISPASTEAIFGGWRGERCKVTARVRRLSV